MEIIKKYNLIWLASYPKSGNTWLRIFLTTLLSNDSYLDLNHLKFSEIYSDASFFKKFYKKDITNFSPEALEKARANLLYFFAQTHEGHLFIKTHELFGYSPFTSKPLLNITLPTAAIYIVRNPMDIAVSFSRYLGISVDDILENYLCNPNAVIHTKSHFPRPIGSWSQHLQSWKIQTYFPVLFVFFEDLKEKPLETFKKIIDFIGIVKNKTEIKNAVLATDFNKLKTMEAKYGFSEKILPTVPFFYKGESGQWKNTLTVGQINKIIASNKDMMKEYS